MKKAKLTSQEVKHIAKLAGLTIDSVEIKKFQGQLSEILDFIKILQKVDTRKVEPTSQVTGLENVFRKDQILNSLSQKAVLANAPNQKNGFFKVKSVKEKWG